jgi:hypothetical protein
MIGFYNNRVSEGAWKLKEEMLRRDKGERSTRHMTVMNDQADYYQSWSTEQEAAAAAEQEEERQRQLHKRQNMQLNLTML